MIYLKTPFKRRWLLTTLAVFIVSLIMVRLGFWQLDRHHQRMDYIYGVIAEVEDAPFTLTGAATDDQYAERIFHLVKARGAFDFDHQIVVKNKFYNEALGYHLVTPFLIEGSDRAVLVDRGWVPPESIHTEADARQYDEPQLTEIIGRIVATEPSAKAPETPQFWWYRVDVENIQRQTPYPLLPYYVAMIAPDKPQTSPPYRNPPKFELDTGVHLSYAVQWFLFAALLPIFYAWLAVRTERNEKKPDSSA